MGIVDWFGIIGSVCSIAGIIFAIFQIQKTLKAAEAAQKAAESATDAIQLNVTLANISACIKEVEEIQALLRTQRYDAALLRVTDLSGKIIQLKAMPQSKFMQGKRDGKRHLTQLSILKTLLEEKLVNNKNEINIANANKFLSEISDDFNVWIGANKYQSGGTK